jgi:hypothetical protein
MVEQSAHNRQAEGSNPSAPTTDDALTMLVSLDGRHFVRCVTVTDTAQGWWARPVGCSVRFFFSRNE